MKFVSTSNAPADFSICSQVGTGLKFEIWSSNGLRSKDHDQIDVQWQAVDGSSSASGPADEVYGMYKW